MANQVTLGELALRAKKALDAGVPPNRPIFIGLETDASGVVVGGNIVIPTNPVERAR